jgi:hypothetical protein
MNEAKVVMYLNKNGSFQIVWYLFMENMKNPSTTRERSVFPELQKFRQLGRNGHCKCKVRIYFQ